jgi:hypothetical protein
MTIDASTITTRVAYERIPHITEKINKSLRTLIELKACNAHVELDWTTEKITTQKTTERCCGESLIVSISVELKN